ncbi:protein NTM1-like 9 isoform X5 [Rhodamnia argentea]|uniref:Protein NTM1-like 9 isoform X5 n=1 Tax=Rhodamnia argentea TaxID=178133 RepID=A0ABM3GSI1_9MYRT|nr:protein NTM1-like 9 isoform X5 [Rhodamnia argentea]
MELCVESSLVDPPVGFQFRPTDEELVNHYLKLKVLGNKAVEQMSPEVDVHQLPPWDLPGKINELSWTKSDGDEWFFFYHLQNKYPQSKRSRRTNDYGSWKPTGKTHEIRTQDKRKILGLKKILVFKNGQSPKNGPTKWVLHEYHLNTDLMDNVLNDQSDVVLYCLKKKPYKEGKEIQRLRRPTQVSLLCLKKAAEAALTRLMKSTAQVSLLCLTRATEVSVTPPMKSITHVAPMH